MNKDIKNNLFAFDEVAADYDRDFSFSQIGMYQRERVYYFLKNYLPVDKSLKVLEINCGTGHDAFWLAKQGCEVTATDGSPVMVESAKLKLKNLADSSMISFHRALFDELITMFPEGSFDMIFSDFAGLNCVDSDDLKKLGKDFNRLLKKDGRLIIVVLGKKCLWETFYFLLKGKPHDAFRRRSKQAVMASVGKLKLPAYYFSPEEIVGLFKNNFTLLEIKPIGIVIPPSYLEPFFKNKKRLLQFLHWIETNLGFSFFANYADHFFISFKR